MAGVVYSLRPAVVEQSDAGFCIPAPVQAIEGYLLTPGFMGNRTGLHSALIIFAVFFRGVALGGIPGMMLAIPLTAFAVVFLRLLKKKYDALVKSRKLKIGQ